MSTANSELFYAKLNFGGPMQITAEHPIANYIKVFNQGFPLLDLVKVDTTLLLATTTSGRIVPIDTVVLNLGKISAEACDTQTFASAKIVVPTVDGTRREII